MAKASFQEAEKLVLNGEWQEFLDLLVEHPELAKLTNQQGLTLLMICSRIGGSEAAVQLLLSLGADPNARANDQSNVLAAAIIGGSRFGLSTVNILDILLSNGADADVFADSGMPALHWAVAQCKPEHTRCLLLHGAESNAVSADGESAFDIAERMQSTELLSILSSETKRKT